MRIHVEMKDAIVFALILAIIMIGGMKIVKLEAQLQNAVLFKTINNHETAIQEIVKFLNGKPWAAAPATMPAEIPKPK